MSNVLPIIAVMEYAVTAPHDHSFSTFSLGLPGAGIGRFATLGEILTGKRGSGISSVSTVIDWTHGDVGLFLTYSNGPDLSAIPAQYTLVSAGKGLAFGNSSSSLQDFSGSGGTLGITVGPPQIGVGAEFSTSATNDVHGVNFNASLWTGAWPTLKQLDLGHDFPHAIGVAGYVYHTQTREIGQVHVGQAALFLVANAAALVSGAFSDDAAAAWRTEVQSWTGGK